MNGSQQFFPIIADHTRDMLMIVDRNRHIVYITPNVYEFSGYSPEEIHNRDTFFMLHPEDREYLEKRHKNLLESKQSNTSEYRIVKKNGEIRYCECKTTPLPDTENYLQVVSIRDITERKLMEMDLAYHKNRHEVLQKSLKNFSHDLSYVMKHPDLEARLTREVGTILPNSNPIVLKTYPENMVLSTGKIEIVGEKVFIKIGDHKQVPLILSIRAEAIREKMESIWLETLAFYAMMVLENLNMIENLIEQLETATKNHETPQWVLRMIFNLQEQQRLTLSSDLHDTVLQDQIDLYRRLEALLNRHDFEKTAKTRLTEIEQGMLDIIHEIRATCNNLRPPLLRELGLERSLENLFEHIQISSTYRIIFSSQDLSRIGLSDEQTIGIYRIVQDLLHHAEEYSRADQVSFDFYHENEFLKMMYRDDGTELDADSSEYIKLTTIKQRAKSLGGKMDLHTVCEGGLIATLEIPITLERSLA
ncbi:PAS domain S-box protein [Neobacillus niacini]|uniref:PAS domain-containing sensor histidine kinase n=1 Tax=Neobacillus niacini TaxID=86668 RepID=UPI0021CB2202|nr:PAS domain S-box protein [Neobacillus niacini]MCM3764415.1 PAS domain S-box protein [Neobacillus niacini]